MTDQDTTDTGMDAGGKAHTKLDEEHPAGDGPRSDRQTGGPTGTDEQQGDEVEGGHGDKPSGFEPHE